MGPDSIGQFINQEEVIKRLAAAQGIDILNLVRSMQEVQQEKQAMQQQAMSLEQQKVDAQALKSPLADPSKNPQLADQLQPPE